MLEIIDLYKSYDNGVLAGIPFGRGVGVELLDQGHGQARFLGRLPHGGLPQSFALVDEATGQGPAWRGVATFHQHDLVVGQLDDHVNGWDGIAVS